MNEQKRRYRIRNWREYNAALVERGSLTVWFDETHQKQWYAAERSGRRGAPKRYSDVAVQCGLLIRAVFHLPVRAPAGVIRSVIDVLGVELATPHYSTVSRRAAALTVRIGRCATLRPRHLLMEASGLKVYGAGEWPVGRHGASKRRTWRKLHVAVDAESHQRVAAELTAIFVGDAEVFPDLLEQLPAEERLAAVAADGAYETQPCHNALLNRGARTWIPPRAGAAAWPPLADGRTHPRTAMVKHIQQHGRKAWKIHSGYHRRSLAETTISRLKILFGERLRHHHFETRTTEAYARLAAMNSMTRLGMPETVALS